MFCLVKLGISLNPELGRPDPLQGLNSLKMPPFLPVALEVLLLEVSRQKLAVRAVARQVRSKVRGLLCFVSEACSAVLSHLVVQTLCDPVAVARQSPCPWGFSRQEYWRGLPFPMDGTQGWNPGLLHCRRVLSLLFASVLSSLHIPTSPAALM